MGRALATLGLAWLAGCAVSLQLSDLDRLERSLEARTVALEADYTLWSPFALDQTRPWVRMVDEELAAARELFGARHDGRLMLVLVPVEGLGPQVDIQGGTARVERPTSHPLHGVAGAAGGGEVVVYVTPDRTVEGPHGPLTGHRAASDYRDTLRHELAHVHARAAGLAGARWLSEGVADLVESFALEDGRLVDRGPDEVTLMVAQTFPPEQWGVERLLEWREDGAAIAAGEEAVDEVSRTLSGLFVRFLLERQPPGSSVVEGLREVHGLGREELLGLEPSWRAWLAAAIAGVGGGLLEGSAGGAGNEPSSH